MSGYPGGVPVTGFVAPTDTSDVYATHDSRFGLGGLHEVADHTERDAIPVNRRREGMICYTSDDKATWQLVGGLDNANWVILTTGSGSKDRFALTKTSEVIGVGGTWDFEIEMGGYTALLLTCKVDFPCIVEIHSTVDRLDPNPYKFIGYAGPPEHLQDDGSTVMSDGSIVYGRRYGILANMEFPLNKRTYGRVTNNGSNDLTVQLDLELLPQ